jgi:large subunit ribosomal protein L28e
MVAVPDQLVWELTKRNTCFLKKKNGHTKRSGAIQFSTEEGNVASLNLFKYSGVANSQAVNVVATNDNKACLVKKTSKCHGQPSKAVSKTMVRKHFHHAEGLIKKQAIDNYYRRDLKSALLGKYTKVYQANRRAKGITKPVPIKKGRGNN